MPLISTVEHTVLFKVRNSTDPLKIEAMIANLRSLTSLNIATYLIVGPILQCRSAAANNLGFTHLLYGRFRSKTDLATYYDHPTHVAINNEYVFPICDDILAVNWVANVDVAPLPVSLLRFTLAKLREGTEVVDFVRAIDGFRVSVPDSVKVSYGENFSPEMAQGYEVGFILAFSEVNEVDVIEGKELEKVRLLLESEIVVDYLVPSPLPSSNGTV